MLAVAIGLEVTGTIGMKLSEGLTRPGPTMLMVLSYLGCFAALSIALKTLELSVAYAVWSGLGLALVTLVGVAMFQESLSLWKTGSILLIILGVIGLKCHR
jgi:small multidrug resistance pump